MAGLPHRSWRTRAAFLVLSPAPLGCGAHAAPAPPVVVVAAPPPKDDGKPSALAQGGAEHSAALEQLLVAPLLGVVDKQRSVRLLVPDARHWTRVKFWGVPTLLGLRYGKDHHAVIGVTVQHVDPALPPSACSKAFEAWGAPLLDAFDVDVARDPAAALAWHPPARPGVAPADGASAEAELHTSYATTASLAVRDGFAVAYATYPVWSGACLVVGIAVPSREDEPRAKAVRDRFAKEVLPRVLVLAKEEPKGRE